MVTSLIPDHDHMYLRINLFGELIKEGVHHLRVDIWGDEAYGPAGFRTGRADDRQEANILRTKPIVVHRYRRFSRFFTTKRHKRVTIYGRMVS